MNLFTSINDLDATYLQEAGSVPGRSQHLSDVTVRNPAGGTDTVSLYSWGGVRSGLFGLIIFHNWHGGGNRVNTAIVIKGAAPSAADVRNYWPEGGASHRPALVVEASFCHLLSFHAISPGGANGAALLAPVSAASKGSACFVGADWNLDPSDLMVPANSCKCPPDGPTHPAARPVAKYDYFVRNGSLSVTRAGLRSVTLSDHLGVHYAF
jgi:hypothetical protein